MCGGAASSHGDFCSQASVHVRKASSAVGRPSGRLANIGRMNILKAELMAPHLPKLALAASVFLKVAPWDVPQNGIRCSSRKNPTTPMLNMSDLKHAPIAKMISGATYPGVPTCSQIESWSSCRQALPKSAITAVPSSRSIMFVALTSRWTMPRWWTCAKPRKQSAMTPRTLSSEYTRCAELANRSPAHNSIAKHQNDSEGVFSKKSSASSSASPTVACEPATRNRPRSLTMFGWPCTATSADNSLRIALGRCTPREGYSHTFRATGGIPMREVARITSAEPPSPSLSSAS
mmetsp:Transcript_78321/g.226454  ORF Transcript_78321/g.226454 Transcript_78321/m.226454 type:complete len:291 (+) Transcript_78321:606-1478(+)